MHLKYIFIIFLLKLVECKIEYYNQEGNNALLKCIEHISKYINENFISFIYFRNNDIDKILKYFNNNTMMLTNSKLRDIKITTDKTDMYIFIINNIQEYDKILSMCNNTRYWNPRAKFLIIFQHSKQIDLLFEKCWNQYIINLIVLNEIGNDINLYTYFPYSNESCRYTNKTKINIKCEDTNLNILYPEKVPFNMHQCPAKFGPSVFIPFVIEPIMTTDDPKISGIETVIIKNLLERMNLNAVMSDLNAYGEWGVKEANGSFTGPFTYLSTQSSEFIFGHMWANAAYVEDFDMSVNYYSSDIFWYVPTASPTKQWKSTIIIFTGSLWITVLMLFFINSLIFWIFGRSLEDIKQMKDLGLCFLYNLYILCMGSTPLPNKLPNKLLLLNWTIFGLLLSLIYQSQLLTLLTKPSFEHQISNLEELVESSLEIIIPYDAIIPMNAYKSKIMIKMLEKSQALDYENIMRRSTSDIDEKTAFLQVTCCKDYLQSKLYTKEDGSSKIFQLKDDRFLWFGTCIYTLKGYPLLDNFNKIIFWFRQNGFLAKWERDLDTTVKDILFNNDPITLNLNHVLSAFCLLGIGLTLSTFMFISELFCYKYKKHTSYL